MKNYRFEIEKYDGAECLHVFVDGGEIVETYIPLDQIQTAMHHAGTKTSLPGIGRIKISTGSIAPYANGERMCLAAHDLCQSSITDADTGQTLSFVSGMEIASTITHGTTVKLIVDESCVELDCHIRQRTESTKDWRLEDAHEQVEHLQSQLKDIADWSETLRYKLRQLESRHAESGEHETIG